MKGADAHAGADEDVDAGADEDVDAAVDVRLDHEAHGKEFLSSVYEGDELLELFVLYSMLYCCLR